MADIFITRKTFDDVLERFDEEGFSYEANQEDTSFSAEELAQALGASGAPALMCLLTDTVDAALIDAAPQLKVIANVAVGYNNVDVAAATERGILVTNTPDVLTETTADLAFALLLAAARRLSEADPYTRAGKYEGWELFQPHLGLDVHGKTLGIVGLGRIGVATARRGALGFGMRVLYHGGSPEPDVVAELGAEEVSLETLLRQSDFVSLHVPLTAETTHMIARRELEMMKPTAILINTARGPVVDEADLVAALKEGLIAGAGLDVFEEEPQLHPELPDLRRHVVLAPHIGSATTETRRRMSLMAAENAIAVLKGQRPPNAVNEEVYS
ncbi:MAG: 2-hydroxyacid dehydrogenase [Chloroflexota bacterium]